MTITRVFVANRGEIALRIVRACALSGVESVLGASEVDMGSAAARAADRVVCIGPGPSAQSYLRPDTLVAAALGTGCDAIHPGYGFLSENAAFAALAREHGIVFVGPPAEVIELAGDKLRAREEAALAGLAVLGGGDERELRYPLLVKAAGGGGGRGIKLVRNADELEALRSLASSEAGAAFGDERVYLERFISEARHIEVQVAADEHGGVIALGERDCSVQRRYQKVIEEAPAPGLPEATREALSEAAVAFARRISYRNVGTVEFVLDASSGEFFFLECNCRIQVEHPVTEAVTGIDLVREQLAIAAGARLSVAREDVRVDGHAIECRLTAEDPERGFQPSPGRITRFALPAAEGLRVDTHCEDGTFVAPYYDSLLAKLIAHGRDRAHAIAILASALDTLECEGVATNRDLLARVLADGDYVAGAVTTTWLEGALPALLEGVAA